MLQPGKVLQKRYRIGGVLGQGGFSAVYLAYHQSLDKFFALKETNLLNPDVLRQFEREARILARLDHPALPAVTDYFSEGGGFYLVMNYIAGEDLGDYLARQPGGRLTEHEALALLAPVMGALRYLHSQQPPIIHRDIKPKNIRRATDGRIYLVDFGIAKEYDPHQKTWTGARALTPGFAPLEQYDGTTDPRTDIYALGMTLYVLLANPAYVPEASKRVRNDPLLPVRRCNPTISPHIECAMMKMVAVHADDRFQSIAEVQQALRPPLPPTAALLPPPAPTAAPTEAPTTMLLPPPAPTAVPTAAPTATLPPPPPLVELPPYLFPPPAPAPEPLTTPQRRFPVWLLVPLALLMPVVVMSMLVMGGTADLQRMLAAAVPPNPPTPTPATFSALSVPRVAPPVPFTATPALPAAPPTATPGKIAFASDRDGNDNIYVMGADGSKLTRLTNDPANDWAPAWSPDGTRIAFDSQRDGNMNIYVMDADGRNQTRLTTDPANDWAHTWSPDGRHIAFVSFRDSSTIIYVMDADGSNQTRLATDPAYDLSPAWSPDGTRIAFRSFRDENWNIYVMEADGSNLTRLTANQAQDSLPAWSPDGTRIAFHSDRDGNYNIYVMEADGSNPTRLTEAPAADRNPAWSPDGTRIAFDSDRDGNMNIYVMDADGSNPTRLTEAPAADRMPAWAP